MPIFVSNLYLKLLQFCNKDTSKVLTLNENNSWKGVFPDLPETDATGAAITYDVLEDPVPTGYTMTKSGSASAGFTNSKPAPSTIDIPVKKVWDGEALDSVKNYLLVNGRRDSSKVLTLNESNNWEGTFTGLPKTDDTGKAIEYDVEEDTVSGYNVSYSGDKTGFTVTNKKRTPPPPVPETGDSRRTLLYSCIAVFAAIVALVMLHALRKRRD